MSKEDKKAIARYRARRDERLKMREDAKDDTKWITVHGAHIPLDEDGNMTGPVAEKITGISDKDRAKITDFFKTKRAGSWEEARRGSSLAEYAQTDIKDARKAYSKAEQFDDERFTKGAKAAEDQFKKAVGSIPDGVEFEMVMTRHNPKVSADDFDKYSFTKKGGKYVGKVENKKDDWRNKEFSWSVDDLFKAFLDEPDYDIKLKDPTKKTGSK